VRPVVKNPATVVGAVAESLGQSLSPRGELDIDVYRLHRTDAEPDLVVRVFGPAVERASVDAAARVLQSFGGTRFPAERCPTDTPVLPIGEGRHLLVTGYVEPSPAPRPGFVLAWCAGLLGRLATRAGNDLPAGGGWHRLGPTPSQEIDEALRLGGQLGPSAAELVDALVEADDGTGLSAALIHADLTPPNAVPQGDQPPVIIDWVGVGRGPRIWPLAFLLFVAGPRGARRALERYARSISLSEEELSRLPGVMIARPLTLDLWSVAYERMTAQQAITRCRAHRARVEAIARALRDPGPR
ncbi:MAG: phosphotransferase, partial [Frankiales bacterium]|nr:phosphotransferase [Frankiales bacterium]